MFLALLTALMLTTPGAGLVPPISGGGHFMANLAPTSEIMTSERTSERTSEFTYDMTSEVNFKHKDAFAAWNRTRSDLALSADTTRKAPSTFTPPREPFVPRFSVTAGAGLLSTPEAAEMLGSLFAGVLLTPFDGKANVSVSATGPYVVGLAWHRSQRSRIGLRYSYQNIITTYQYGDGSVRSDIDYHTIMLHTWRRYLHRGIFTAYGTADVGLAIREAKASAFSVAGNPVDDARKQIPLIAGQFNLLGVSLGTPRVQVYTELGWGYLGLIQFGARVGL